MTVAALVRPSKALGKLYSYGGGAVTASFHGECPYRLAECVRIREAVFQQYLR